MSISTVGLLHPGKMGVTLGIAAADRAEIVWVSQGRGDQTRQRARDGGLRDVEALPALVAQVDLILCVCPPDSAHGVAQSVSRLGFGGIYVDANAVSPETSRAIASTVAAGGARFVDGGIIGPPAQRPGTTRLYLSGERATEVASLFSDTAVQAVAIDGPVGAASALKMCYAAWTKGSDALLLAVRALAAAEGVDRDLVAEWAISQAGLEARSERAATKNAAKAWRFVGEMHQIADTFERVSLPDGFHRGAAEIYRRLESYRDAATEPRLDEVVRAIIDSESAADRIHEASAS